MRRRSAVAAAAGRCEEEEDEEQQQASTTVQLQRARVIAPKHPTPTFDELYNIASEQFNGWRTYRLQGRLEVL